MLRICDFGRAHGLKHFFYGGAPGVAEKLAANLQSQFPGMIVAGCACPPFRALTEQEDQAMVDAINASGADVVWIGLGAPKQEKWMAAQAGKLNAAATIGVGAAFDFHAGNVRWAPRWMRNWGLEWMYRLWCEPKRMWRRNLDSPLFLIAVILQLMAQMTGQMIARIKPVPKLQMASSKTIAPEPVIAGAGELAQVA
jgi:N-acetylglucosaminyldiphosphoundecaprenol N-acetyl-beta-D-mannosaminyltransferase